MVSEVSASAAFGAAGNFFLVERGRPRGSARVPHAAAAGKTPASRSRPAEFRALLPHPRWSEQESLIYGRPRRTIPYLTNESNCYYSYGRHLSQPRRREASPHASERFPRKRGDGLRQGGPDAYIPGPTGQLASPLGTPARCSQPKTHSRPAGSRSHTRSGNGSHIER